MSDLPLSVEVVFASAARSVQCVQLTLKSGATVGQALIASGLLSGLAPREVGELEIGIWGRAVDVGHLLRDKDRVELYRRLRVDPKVARRERFKKQGAKTAGLFAKRRQGAKTGY